MFPDNLQHLFVRIAVGHADVYRKTALGRDDVVLRTRRDDRNAHFDCSEQVGFLRETVGPEPFDVPHRFVDGIVPLFACGVSRFAVRRAVDYHQASFGDGQLHQRRFAHDREFQRAQVGNDAFESARTAVFFFGRNRHAEVVFQVAAVVVVQECRKQRHAARSRVVAAQPVQPVPFDLG